jgi:hypothetical protein
MERIMITITLISASILSISLAFYTISMAMDNKRNKNNNKDKSNTKNQSMTPKEKARELIKKYDQYYFLSFNMNTDNFYTENARRFALITVDEILLNMIFWEPANPYGLEINKRRYWQKVKEELEDI